MRHDNGIARINLEGLKQGMESSDLDVLLAASPENFFYLADSLNLSQKIIPDRLCIAVLPRDGEPAAVVCSYEQPQTKQDSWIGDIETYLEFEQSPIGALAELLEKRGLARGRIGIEKKFLVANTLEEMAESMPKAALLGADHVFDQARAIKRSSEIAILSRAAILTEQAILDAFQAARTGDTEKKVADDLSMRVLRSGATSHWIVLAAGSNTSINPTFPISAPERPSSRLRVVNDQNLSTFQPRNKRFPSYFG